MKNGIIEDDVIDLGTALDQWAAGQPARAAIGDMIASIAAVAVDLEQRIAKGELCDAPTDGDRRKTLDAIAEDMLVAALSDAPIAIIGSAAREKAIILDPSASFALTLSPLDGASNIDTNIPAGTIFSILPISDGDSMAEALLQPGNRQLAAGFIL
ncbi:MAG: class 1 fructose-bisphosphatase, partial [Pseudomonadota bacterium]